MTRIESVMVKNATNKKIIRPKQRFTDFKRIMPILRIATSSSVNPLRSDSGQRRISLCNINVFPVREVMRIKDMITHHEFR